MYANTVLLYSLINPFPPQDVWVLTISISSLFDLNLFLFYLTHIILTKESIPYFLFLLKRWVTSVLHRILSQAGPSNSLALGDTSFMYSVVLQHLVDYKK